MLLEASLPVPRATFLISGFDGGAATTGFIRWSETAAKAIAIQAAESLLQTIICSKKVAKNGISEQYSVF